MGYTGGTKPNPTYDSVCRGDGHTEAMKVEFDPSVISYEALMQKFFAEAGAGGGKVQYQSAVWPQDEQQAAVARQVATEKKSTVPVLPPTEWFDAEEYHRACPCPRSNPTSRRQSHCDFGLSPCAEDYIAKVRMTYGR